MRTTKNQTCIRKTYKNGWFFYTQWIIIIKKADKETQTNDKMKRYRVFHSVQIFVSFRPREQLNVNICVLNQYQAHVFQISRWKWERPFSGNNITIFTFSEQIEWLTKPHFIFTTLCVLKTGWSFVTYEKFLEFIRILKTFPTYIPNLIRNKQSLVQYSGSHPTYSDFDLKRKGMKTVDLGLVTSHILFRTIS